MTDKWTTDCDRRRWLLWSGCGGREERAQVVCGWRAQGSPRGHASQWGLTGGRGTRQVGLTPLTGHTACSSFLTGFNQDVWGILELWILLVHGSSGWIYKSSILKKETMWRNEPEAPLQNADNCPRKLRSIPNHRKTLRNSHSGHVRALFTRQTQSGPPTAPRPLRGPGKQGVLARVGGGAAPRSCKQLRTHLQHRNQLISQDGATEVLELGKIYWKVPHDKIFCGFVLDLCSNYWNKTVNRLWLCS